MAKLPLFCKDTRALSEMKDDPFKADAVRRPVFIETGLAALPIFPFVDESTTALPDTVDELVKILPVVLVAANWKVPELVLAVDVPSVMGPLET